VSDTDDPGQLTLRVTMTGVVNGANVPGTVTPCRRADGDVVNADAAEPCNEKDPI